MKRFVIILVLLFSYLLNGPELFAGIGKNPVQIVKLQLKWTHQFEFAGYYAAIEKGFYEEAGIHVELLLPDGVSSPIDAVNIGRADFGISASDILLARSKDKKVVVLSSIFQHSPYILLVNKASGITTPRQLKGKTIALESDSAEIIAYLNNSMVFPKSNLIIPLKYDAEQLINGEADAISAYITDEPFLLDSIGFKYQVLAPIQGGIDFYGDVLFTSEKLIKTNPELVENFRKASLKGWHYAMDHPHEIIFLISTKYSNQHTVNHLTFEMNQMKDLIQEEFADIGYSNPKRWQKILKTYQNLGLIKPDFTTDGLLYQYQSPPFIFPWKVFGVMFLILTSISFLTYVFYKSSINLKREIETRHQIQIELAKSEELYRSVINASPDTITITDLEGIIEFASPQVRRMYGYEPEEIINQHLLNFVDPRDHGKTQQAIHQMFADKFTGAAEYRGIKSDGQTVHIEANGEFIRNNAGTPQKMIFVTRDISKRKEAEEKLKQSDKRLRKIVEQTQTVIWEVDAEGLYTYISPVVKSAWGYSPEELTGKMHFYDLHPAENREEFKNAALNVFASKLSFTKLENSILAKDGRLLRLETNGVPILDDKNKLTGYLGSDNDITAREKAEMEIRNLNAQLEEKIVERTQQLLTTNKSLATEIEERKKIETELYLAKNLAEKANMAKSEFLSRMSHELRTPMNSILGFAQLLEMGEPNKTQLKRVHHILKSGKHLLNLINEVLDITRIESGGLMLSVEPVQTGPVINEIIDSIMPQATEKQVHVSLKNSPANQLFVSSDRQRLKQILINLLDNAVKYNKVGGLVTVETELISPEDEPMPFVRISITDTGRGIHPDDTSKLFNPFERIGAEATGEEGSGLGLTVVKKLITAMDGRIGIESTPNEGSTFWIELPQIESQLETAGLHFDSCHTESENKKGTILYIEDNQPNIELIEQILISHRTNINLVTTMNGQEAVELAKKVKPNLILLDLNLPDIHGYEVIQKLKENLTIRDIPVVVVSADAMKSQIERLKNAGAVEYLTKPLNIPAFLDIIDQYLPG